jgi:hypothetical protein
MKRSFLQYLLCSAAIGVLLVGFVSPVSARGPVSPDGLELSGFRFATDRSPARVGDMITVKYKLKNVTGVPIRFHPGYGVFVGARWNSVSDANNRDFGHTFQGGVLKPGKAVTMSASRRLDAPGDWRFWPAYNIRGHWGPFRWNEAVVRVSGRRPPMHERGMHPMDRR